MKRFLFSLFACFLSFGIQPAFSSEGSPLLEESEIDSAPVALTVTGRFESLTQELVRTYLPELETYKIKIRYFNSKESALKSGFRVTDVFVNPRDRQYHILISRNYLESLPSWYSLKAVVLHELYHILDYTRMDGSELRKLLIKLVLNPGGFVPRYEKCTDFRAISHGLDREMLDYRLWQQANLPEKFAHKKLRNYFKPAELESGEWKSFSDCPNF